MIARRLFALALCLLSPSPALLAADGEVDATFANGGSRTLSFQFPDLPGVTGSVGHRVAFIPGTSPFAQGSYWVLARYWPTEATGVRAALATLRLREDGTVISGYGTYGNGTARAPLTMDNVDAVAHANWIDGGIRVDKAFALGTELISTGERRLRLCRVNGSGALDSGVFGTAGSGCFSYSFQDSGANTAGAAMDLVADGEHLYLIAERLAAGGATSIGVVRVSAVTGALDTTYGFGGFASIAFSPSMSRNLHVAGADVDPVGRLVVAASFQPDGSTADPVYAGVARLTPAGQPDATFCGPGIGCALGSPGLHRFGTNQLFIPPKPHPLFGSVTVTEARIYFSLQNDSAVSRTHIVALREDGTLAREFGSNGVAQRPSAFPALAVSSFPILKGSARGSLLVAGVEFGIGLTQTTASFGRLNASGACAPEFVTPCPRVLPGGVPPIDHILIDPADRPVFLTQPDASGTLQLVRLQPQRELLADGFE
ncbi:MAG: hypothetical protein LW860_17165 [Xanthomonadaceae bacterium]|nr:hypothetical protein [Xanthomonadaceae bacterium]